MDTEPCASYPDIPVLYCLVKVGHKTHFVENTCSHQFQVQLGTIGDYNFLCGSCVDDP